MEVHFKEIYKIINVNLIICNKSGMKMKSRDMLRYNEPLV